MTQPLDGIKRERDRPWMFRTYAGHSNARDSNALYRKNLAKGQTGLSVAFDLPTQTGYDSDHVLARGEVGKVGVPISHIGDMRTLFEQIPLDAMNTSMTINATAAWLLALYVAVADEQNVPRAKLTGTTQNDIVKEYLSRGTHVFPPAPSMRLIKDTILFTTKEMPKWNPMNVCSYHLQEAGATPVQELAFALATAIAVLDTVKASGEVEAGAFGEVVGRISFFVNAGMRFITELCKMRAFCRAVGRDHRAALWRQRSEAAAVPLRRAGQFARADRAAARKQRLPHPDRDARRHAVEERAGARGAVAGLERGARPAAAWDQQWSLRMQQILAYETDLLEYGDIFDGSTEIARKVDELKRAALDELSHIERLGGAIAAVEMGYMKGQLVESNSQRVEAIERGELIVVGVNKFKETEPSPLVRRRGRDPHGAARGRGRADRAAQCLARRARPEAPSRPR